MKSNMWTPKLGERYKLRFMCKQCQVQVVLPNTDYCSEECQKAGEVRLGLDPALAPPDPGRFHIPTSQRYGRGTGRK